MRFNKLFRAFMLAASVASIAGCASTPRQDSTGQYLDDAAITTKVKAAIFADPNLKVFEIKVVTFKGEVQLSGFVGSRDEELKALDLARHIKGVRGVQDNMSVK